MVLKALLIEDNPERQEILINLFKDHAWILANSAHRAIRLLKAYEFDLVFLDYDLAGPDKGDEVARYLSTQEIKKPQVIIHSMNDPGVQRILAWLPHANSIPFSKIIRDNRTFKKIRTELAKGPDINWGKVFQRNNF